MDFEPSLEDFPFLEYYRLYGHLPLETQSFYQDLYPTILRNKLEENFKDGRPNENAKFQKLEDKRFEVEFLSDSLIELRSAMNEEIDKHPEREVTLNNIYLEVGRFLEEKIKLAQNILKETPSTFTSSKGPNIDQLYTELKVSFIETKPEDFKSIFGFGKFKKPVVWLETEALLVYFVDLLFKKEIVDEDDEKKIHLITSNCFIRQNGQHFDSKQLSKTKYNISSYGSPRKAELLDKILNNLGKDY